MSVALIKPSPPLGGNTNQYQQYVDMMNKQIAKQMNMNTIMNTFVTTTSSSTPTVWVNTTGTTNTVPTATMTNFHKVYYHDWQDPDDHPGRIKVKHGRATVIEMPDGAVIQVHADGSYDILTDDVKVRYKANPVREFNRYINASDLLEEFIDFVGELGTINKAGFLELPIELFIKWLVVRAAEADGETVDEDKATLRAELLPPPPVALLAAPVAKTGHCKCCGRFITNRRREASALFCSSEHFDRYLEKAEL